MALAPLSAPELRPLAHGFFTRAGGVSTGIYDSLNAGQGSADGAEAVAENRRRIAGAMGGETLVTVRQIHSPTALTIDGPWEGEAPEADALVTATPGVILTVLSADCAPVLMACRESGVIGAAHSGWKGAVDGVLEATVAGMKALGARGITAVIGPCISQRAYEVGPEFVERFCDEDPENARHFAGGAGDRAQFDLPGYALGRLRAAGVAASWTGHCTYGDEARFFSYRRATHRGERDYGRLAACIML